MTQFVDICQRTVTDRAKKVHGAQQILVVRSVLPWGLRHFQQFRPNTVTMVTTAWHLWQWQIDWPQWNIWEDTGRACVHGHTIKTSGHEGTVTGSQLHLEEVKNFMDEHAWRWSGEQDWQGVHLQLAYCGMLIRPAKTRHLPLKCHTLMRRAESREQRRVLLTSVGRKLSWSVCLSSGNFFSVLFTPSIFSQLFSCAFSLPFCCTVYSVMNGSISTWAFFFFF